MVKPSILGVIGQRVELRTVGREFVGLCPFHDDRHPSLFVNPDKGVFLCRACQERGDVFNFIMKLDGLTFPDACRALGIVSDGQRPVPRVSPNRNAAALLAGWLNQQYILLGVRLRELSSDIAFAQQIPNRKFVESLKSEWEILSDLHGDLQRPEYAEEFWRLRDSIQALITDVEAEPLDEFPPLTEAYRNYLRSVVEC